MPASLQSPLQLPNTSPHMEKSDPRANKRNVWDQMPTWVSSNLRSRKSWKMLVRCCVASWVSFIILLPSKSLQAMGNAAFFGLLGSLMIPPNMPVQMYLAALLTLIVGECLGWAFGAAGMRAALAVRNQVVTQAELQKVAQSAAGLANPDALYVASIFNGDFLDTNSTVLFGVFLGIGTFLLALIRAYAPRLTLLSIFGTIAIDIYCSYGPLFPFPQYTILNSLLISLSCYVAIGLVTIILVFPETLNHAALSSTSELLGHIGEGIMLQEEILNAPAAQLIGDGEMLGKAATAREHMIANMKQLSSQLPLLNLEFSWGKWNGNDIKALKEPLMTLVGRLAALQGFSKLLGSYLSSSADLSEASFHGEKPDAEDWKTEQRSVGDAELFRQLHTRHHSHAAPIPLTDLVPVLGDATRELREASANAIASCKAVIDSINTKRYIRGNVADLKVHLAELDAAEQRLVKAIDAFKERDRLILLEPFHGLLDAVASGKQIEERGNAPFRPLYIAFVFTANLVTVAKSAKAVVEVIGDTARKRRQNRLWAPKGIRAIGKLITQRGDAGERALGEDPAPFEEEEPEQVNEKAYSRDPDAGPPSNFVQHIMNTVHGAYLWAKTPEALFAFKYAALTIALWIPAVCKTSAHFIYAQKGLWALIMAQTTLNIYAADQIWNLVLRLAGTFVGLVVGLLCWYIGSAKSDGSPYGMAASVAVFLFPVLFLRLFAPPKYVSGIMMGAVTWALIVGYSWLDGHITVLGDVGIGWPVAWRRFVLVIIGSVASFVVMILPPTSARKSVRLRCSSTISSLSSLYQHLMSAWINDRAFDDSEKGGSEESKWAQQFRERFIGVSQDIQLLKAQASIAKFEGNVRGTWASEEYNRLADVEGEIAVNLAVIGGSLAHLDHGTRIALLRHTKVVNPNFISDVISTFVAISQSLRTGESLYQAQFQDLMERVFYHGDYSSPIDRINQEARNDFRLQHLQSIFSYDYMFYASAIVSVFKMLQGVNEARAITSRLCGEVPMVGFEQWRETFERDYSAAVLSS
ncbi:uncharacterized protein LAESUDRAFT_729774 [Laetiporus sulphureus 93-53]|uniref:ER transporter 6TM N-terminal domain-containing protein n=1 Tax=Laetiporus sulphureus 93-53 TaxID=1314785 RepID=A0A165CHC0_9APHY|nr:uncharacterized protein LAESUDRAFT_729774 [Laetiporus sulphureus 93-53]KZT02812.1 hypothetical protein LAESUDRAFT_729774 [Laetiporus sulphureus 93-53]